MANVSDNFTIVRGDTYVESWAITLNGSAVDLTGGKLYFTLKSGYAVADPGSLQLTSPSSGITIDNAAGGLATMTITATQTAALTPGAYVYDIQFKDSNGKVTTFARGIATVDYDVTVSTA